MRNDIVQIARRWLGTPYQHQASVEGIGADCLGLVRGIWREVYGAEPLKIPAYTPDWSETSGDEVLLEAVGDHCREVDIKDMQVGDLLVFRMREAGVAKHLGVLSAVGPRPQIIHAYSGYGVVETPLSSSWARRIAGVFRFPDRSK